MIIHIALSVDIDRLSDIALVPYVEMVSRQHPAIQLPRDLRLACACLRSQGFVVFPPCDHTKPNGMCAGHAPEIAIELQSEAAGSP